MASLTDLATRIGQDIKARRPVPKDAPSGFDANTLRGLNHYHVSVSNDAPLHMPPTGVSNDSFDFEVRPIAANADIQFAFGFLSGGLWSRTRYNEEFSAWVKIAGNLTDYLTKTEAASQYAPTTAPAAFNANTVTGDKQYRVTLTSGASNMPDTGYANDSFAFDSRRISATSDVQWALSYMTGNLYYRTRYNTGYLPWQTIGGPGLLTAATAASTYLSKADAGDAYVRKGDTSAGSGMKRLPLALTLGHPNANAATSGQHRIPFRFNAPITRWRLHCSLMQPKTGVPRGTNVSVTGVKVGLHAGSGVFSSTPFNAAGPFQVSEDGSDWTSPWVSGFDIGDDKEMLLSFGYTATDAPWNLIGGSWASSDPGTFADLAPAGMTLGKSTPLDWWIEAETYAQTPALGVFGDSLSCGAGATVPVYDSMLSQLCRRIGALPVHWAASGDAMASWLEEYAPFKRDRWDHLDRPDSVIWAMGNNDAFGRVFDLPTMQSTWAAMLPIVQQHMSPVIYGSTITPRTGDTSAQEQVRRDYNAWLATRLDIDGPLGGYRDLFDFVTPISADDETIRPEFDADGVHLNTAGYAAQALAVNRPVTSPRVQYAP